MGHPASTAESISLAENRKPEDKVIEFPKKRTKAVTGSARRFVLGVMSHITEGELIVEDPECGKFHFGNPDNGMSVVLRINDSRFYSAVAAGGSLGLGESFMERWWEVENDALTDFIGIILLNRLYLKVTGNLLVQAQALLHSFMWNSGSVRTSKKCVSRHYDLSNDFFSLILDSTMGYSCGCMVKPGDSLETMQCQKYELICRKLGLERGGRLLDIGCGWGGFVMYAAEHFPKISCSGITLSEKQVELAKERIMASGLDGRAEIHLCDYRNKRGIYGFIVSVGMFEHVGKKGNSAFMRQVKKMLSPILAGMGHPLYGSARGQAKSCTPAG